MSDRKGSRGRYAALLAAALFLVIALGSVLFLPNLGSGQDPSGSAQRQPPDRPPAADISENYRMWASLANPGAEYAEHYQSLESIATGATATVLGRVIDAGHGREIIGDVEADRFSLGQITLSVEEVLAGDLPRQRNDGTILLETLDEPSVVARSGRVIAMLRWTPEIGNPALANARLEANPELEFRYALANAQAVWVPGEERVRAPLLEHPADDPVFIDVGNDTFEGLAARIRSMGLESR